MMDRSLVLSAALASLLAVNPADAQVRFPRVYGATGHLYGPTQAHYQYYRQYGRPWHGYGGYTAYGVPATSVVVGGYPAWGGYAAPYYFATPVVVSPLAPVFSFYSPGVIGGYGMYGMPGYYWPYPNYAAVQPKLAPTEPLPQPLAEAWKENLDRWGPELPPAKPDPITLPVPPSSNEAKLKSLRAIQDGDDDLQRQQWIAAYSDYKRAVQAAPDNAQAYFRQGLAMTAVQHYDTAVFSFKRALALDPTLPQTGSDLETIFGPDSIIARNSILLKAADYVKADIRSPDRLFLFGVLLHFSHDARAAEVFEAGYRLAGKGQHFLAFLKPETKTAQPAAPATDPKTPPLPPAPLPALPDAAAGDGPVLPPP